MMSVIAVAAILAALSGVVGVVLVVVLLRQRQQKIDFAPLFARMDALDRVHERLERTLRDDLAGQRTATSDGERRLREELAASDKLLREEINARMHEGFGHTFNQLVAIRATMTEGLETLRQENGRKLDEMRQVVDEKLQSTLDRRIGESFRLVSENLERVQRGLGEMQTLAAGVGDLKKVLSNVKTRGTWGEVQLGSLLEQILSPTQYEANVCTKGEGLERVEYAIKLPSKLDDDGILWLPIDAKFPQEDYLRLVEAQDAANADEADSAGKALEARIRDCAHDISTKYVSPPKTTDFGIMFLPSEGLYAEVIRRTGLVERLQRETRVVVAGPTTLAAILNTFQMGFRTLAIQKQSSEVWNVLGQVKTEFAKFGGVLDKVRKKLTEASNVVDTVGVRSRAIEKTLRSVEAMPVTEELIGALPALEAELDGPPDDAEVVETPLT
ncbi:MAG TPA: DNA recombination protein RmuC [Gemmatimonadaceae bacterium]|jgi:DNA recombination protein RmuC